MRIIYGITIIIYCMLVIILHTLLYIKNKSKQGRKGKSANGTEEREEQGKGCRRHIATDRPATNRGAGLRAVCHPAASRLRPAGCCSFLSSLLSLRPDLFRSLLPDVLPASCPPLPLCQVVRVGQTTSQGRRSPPAHPADPLHPAGGLGILTDTPEVGEGVGLPSQGGGGDLRESLFREFFRGCISLNINYLFSPRGRAV